MQQAAKPIGMNNSDADITLDASWQAEQTDRLIGFEFLTRTLQARYQPIEPEHLADKIASHKGLTNLIIQGIRKKTNATRRTG